MCSSRCRISNIKAFGNVNFAVRQNISTVLAAGNAGIVLRDEKLRVLAAGSCDREALMAAIKEVRRK